MLYINKKIHKRSSFMSKTLKFVFKLHRVTSFQFYKKLRDFRLPWSSVWKKNFEGFKFTSTFFCWERPISYIEAYPVQFLRWKDLLGFYMGCCSFSKFYFANKTLKKRHFLYLKSRKSVFQLHWVWKTRRVLCTLICICWLRNS